ncbi:MAG TPA: alpha-amylase family glycosyl hydrolase, partial [Edaphobacter sp.]
MPSRRAVLLTLLLSAPALSQTLARPGWAGSGMSANPWWKHAVIYHANPSNFNNIQGITQRLDHLHSLGVDAILLTPLQPDPAHAESIDPTLGTLDDLDDLIHQSSRNNIRVLLELDPATPNLTAVARFWLTRGIAGFHLSSTPSTTSQITDLRKLTNTFVGQRILITDLTATPDQPRDQPKPHEPPQLLL